MSVQEEAREPLHLETTIELLYEIWVVAASYASLPPDTFMEDVQVMLEAGVEARDMVALVMEASNMENWAEPGELIDTDFGEVPFEQFWATSITGLTARAKEPKPEPINVRPIADAVSGLP
jgi:hypothetical protein